MTWHADQFLHLFFFQILLSITPKNVLRHSKLPEGKPKIVPCWEQ